MTEWPEHLAMPPAAEGDSEPVKWPIAPDGYIPNSVIRSRLRRRRRRRRGGEGLHPADGWDEIFISVSPPDGGSADDEEDVTSKVVWPNEYEDDDDEEIDFKVKRREKGRGPRVPQERKMTEEKRDARREKEEDVRRTVVLQEQSHDLKPEPILKKPPGPDVEPERERLDSTVSEKNSVRGPVTEPKSRAEPSEQSGPEPSTERKGNVESSETVGPPRPSVAPPEKPATLRFIPKAVQQPPVRRPAVTVSPKQEPEIESKLPERAPVSSPQDPRPQSEPARSLRSLAKLLNSKDREQVNETKDVNIDYKRVLDVLRKSRAYKKNLASLQKMSTAPSCHPAKVPRPFFDNVTLGLNLKGGLYRSPTWKATKQSGSGRQSRASDQGGPRTSSAPLHTWILPVATHQIHPVTDDPAKSFRVTAGQATAASLLPGSPPTHTRVVHRVRMDGAPEVTPRSFSHVIPKASQHGFVTANTRGETHYGRLQFEWLRGKSGEHELLVGPSFGSNAGENVPLKSLRAAIPPSSGLGSCLVKQ